MRNKVLVTLAGFLFLCLPTPITAQRIIENWNFGWRFHRGEIDENQLASPDTSGWEVIDVPRHRCRIGQLCGRKDIRLVGPHLPYRIQPRL